MISNLSKVLYIFFCGIFFALLQASYFFLLQMSLSSAYITYFTVVLAWLCGSWLGLRIALIHKEIHLAFLAMVSVYLLYILTGIFPFQMNFLPLYILLVISSSLYAGYFFKAQRQAFIQVKYLFIWETLGFIFGLIFSFLGFILFGKRLILFGPLLTFFLVFVFFKFKGYVTAYDRKNKK